MARDWRYESAPFSECLLPFLPSESSETRLLQLFGCRFRPAGNSSLWCNVVNGYGMQGRPMKAQRTQRQKLKIDEPGTIRASISFPSDLYGSLELAAQQKKVSLAWVVRDAVEKYLLDNQAASLRPDKGRASER